MSSTFCSGFLPEIVLLPLNSVGGALSVLSLFALMMRLDGSITVSGAGRLAEDLRTVEASRLAGDDVADVRFLCFFLVFSGRADEDGTDGVDLTLPLEAKMLSISDMATDHKEVGILSNSFFSDSVESHRVTRDVTLGFLKAD